MSYKGPIKDIPAELLESFTMKETIPVIQWFWDGSLSRQLVWSSALIDRCLAKFTRENILDHRQGWEPYTDASAYFVSTFDSYPVLNKSVAVIGTQFPWIESIVVNYGARHVTTVEYNVPKCSHPAISTISYAEFEQKQLKFDCIVTYSSVEHSGLGRYGDLLDPEGDLKAMRAIYNSLEEDGLLFWGAPVGKDALVWNAHRVYGPKRLPLMFKDFEIVEWFGFTHDSMKDSPVGTWKYQPVIVLRKRTNRMEKRQVILDKTQMSHESGECYTISFPSYYMPFDYEDDPKCSTLKLYENDVPLLEPHSSHEEIIRFGKGRYSHWYDTLRFSTSDNSDPRTNGHEYSIDLT